MLAHGVDREAPIEPAFMYFKKMNLGATIGATKNISLLKCKYSLRHRGYSIETAPFIYPKQYVPCLCCGKYLPQVHFL